MNSWHWGMESLAYIFHGMEVAALISCFHPQINEFLKCFLEDRSQGSRSNYEGIECPREGRRIP